VKIASQLGDLRAERNRSDYDLDDSRNESGTKAQALVSQTSRMIRALDRCTADTARRDAMAHSIRTYAQRIQGG